MSLLDTLWPPVVSPPRNARVIRPLGPDEDETPAEAAERKRRAGAYQRLKRWRAKHAGHRKGETHHRAKLNDVAVARIRELRARDPKLWTLTALADLFGCGLSTVRDICDRTTRPL